VAHLKKWLSKTQESMRGAYFYSDSHNDLPMLELVEHPVAVHADQKLQSIAKDRNWPILDWT